MGRVPGGVALSEAVMAKIRDVRGAMLAHLLVSVEYAILSSGRRHAPKTEA